MDAIAPSASDHPVTWTFGYPIHHVESRGEWRAWLSENHGTTAGVWLCSWRTATGRATCPYPEAVEEAICFGWIDSTVNVLDDERALQLFTPRRPKSTWTRLNRTRAAEMEAAGLMTDAGRRTIEIARATGWWTILEPVEALVEPVPLAEALDRTPAARVAWDRFPPSARKAMLWWVISAVRDVTRDKRIETIVAAAERGERARG